MRPSRTRQHRTLTAAVALLFVATARWADGAPGPPVRVRVEIAAPTLTQNWGQQGFEAVKHTLQQDLAGRLQPRLAHWEFVPAEPTPSAPGPEALFQVTELVPKSLSVVIVLRRPGLVVPLRKVERWLAASDLMILGVPPPDTAAGEILSAIATRLLDRHEVELRRWLSDNVPVGLGAYWLDGDRPRLVLALPWSRYEALRESVFRLVCDWPAQGTATVESIGPGVSAPYKPPSPATLPDPPFEGLLVIAREREFAGQVRKAEQVGPELFELRPRLVYLKEYVPAVDWLTGDPR